MSKSLDPLKSTPPELYQIRELIITGCSFSSGHSDIDHARKQPQTWSHFVARWCPDLRHIVNLAMPNSGNIAASQNLRLYFETQGYDSAGVAVLFNLTGLDRYDILCEIDAPNVNPFFGWDKVLQHGVITAGTYAAPRESFLEHSKKIIGYQNVIKHNALAILAMFHYLEQHGIPYAFMIMDHTVMEAAPEWLITAVQTRNHHMVNLDGGTMFEFCQARNLVADDGFHPSILGYEAIARRVCEFLGGSAE